MREWAPVAVVGLVFVVFCAVFVQNTPYRSPGVLLHQRGPDGLPARVPDVGAPDERQHANYVAAVAEGRGVPVFDPAAPDLFENYQAHQPPLYYVVAAGWSKLVGSDPRSPDTGGRLRFLNVLIGLATVGGLALGAFWVYKSWAVAWAASAVVLLPMSIALHSAVSNDPLLFCLCTWTLALLGKAMSEGWKLQTCLTIGLLSGLACLTKTTAVVLLPTVLLAVVWSVRSENKPRAWPAALLVLVPVVLAAPWWARNTALYGDPLALGAFKDAFQGSPQASMFIQAFGPTAYWTQWVGWWTARSGIGVFGYMDLFLFEGLGMDKSGALYVALWVLLLVPVVAGLLPKKGTGDRLVGKVSVVWAVFSGLVVLAFVRFNMQYFQGQARYLYPAIAPFAWCLGWGMTKILRAKPHIGWVIVLAFLATLDFVAASELHAGFARRLV